MTITDALGKAKTFNLFGVVCHHGTLNTGHYTNLVRDCSVKESPTWYKCNDEYIRSNDINRPGSKTPTGFETCFILFYVRQDSAP